MAIMQADSYKQEVIEKYLPLVKYIASRVIIGKSRHIEYEDLVSYGVVGLIDAFNKFDESKGMKFSTYASIRVKGAMIDELRKNSPISKGAMDKLNRYNAVVEKLQNQFMREPSDAEIARELGMTIYEVKEVEGYIGYLSQVSLEELIYSEDDDIVHLYKAIDMLNEKDQLVLNLYYKERLTLKEIGKILEVSESRVCQLHTRAIVHLRANMKKLKYD